LKTLDIEVNTNTICNYSGYVVINILYSFTICDIVVPKLGRGNV